MRWWVVLLLVVPAIGQATTWYVRPASGEYSAEDGSNYANAFDGFADLNGSYGSINAGDTIKVCGTFVAADAQSSPTYLFYLNDSGSAGSPIIVDGDCSADGDLSRAVINAETSIQRVMQVADNTYLTIKNLELKNGTTRGFLGYNVGTVTADRYLTLDNLYVHDISGGTSPTGIDLRGRGNTVKNSEVENIGTDGIYSNGAGLTLHDNTVTSPSIDDTAGDCYQLTGETAGFSSKRDTCDHSNKLSKYCLISSGVTDSGSYHIQAFTCTQATSGSCTGNPAGTYLEGTGLLEGSRFTGGCYGIQHVGNNQTASGNIVVGQQQAGIITGGSSTGQIIQFNTVYNTPIGIDIGSNNATNKVINNIVSTTTTACVEKQGSSVVEQYNDLYSCGTDTVTENGVTASAGTGTITTNPALDSSYDISSTSPAWSTGIYAYPWRGKSGKCSGTVINMGATCALPVPYGYTIKPQKARR